MAAPRSSSPSSTSTDTSSHASSDSDETSLVLNLDALKNIASSHFSRSITNVQKLTQGRFHEIHVLSFSEDGLLPRTCIARFPLSDSDSSSADASAIATMCYVKFHTTIPVPEIYCKSKPSDIAAVGASFVLMEHMHGEHLYKLWGDLSLDDKLLAVDQIAGVIAQLGSLEFDQIGMLRDGDEGTPQGLVSIAHPRGRGEYGPWKSTEQWMLEFLHEGKQDDEINTTAGNLDSVKQHLHNLLTAHSNDPSLQAPFGLLHTDFDAQNLLFTNDPELKLTAVIDWDYAQTAPKYFIYDFPIFLQNDPYQKEDWNTNKDLRRHFVRSVKQHLSRASEKLETMDTPDPAENSNIPKRWPIWGFLRKLKPSWMLDCFKKPSLKKRNYSEKRSSAVKLNPFKKRPSRAAGNNMPSAVTKCPTNQSDKPPEVTHNKQLAAAANSFAGKSYLLNHYMAVFMTVKAPMEEPERSEWCQMRESMVKYFLQDLDNGTGDTYDGGWYDEEKEFLDEQ